MPLVPDSAMLHTETVANQERGCESPPDDERSLPMRTVCERPTHHPYPNVSEFVADFSEETPSAPEATFNPFDPPPPRERRLPALRDRTAIKLALGMNGTSEHRFDLDLDGTDSVCPISGHHGIAQLELANNLTDLCIACDCFGPWFQRCLADAYWSHRTGRRLGFDGKLNRGTRFVARLLLTHELGMIEPRQIELPELTPDAKQAAVTARDFFALLYGLRLAHEPETVEAEGIAFSDRLLAQELGTTRDEARSVIKALERRDVIKNNGRHAGPRSAYLWSPGAAITSTTEEK